MVSSPDRTAVLSIFAGLALAVAPVPAVALDPQPPVLVSRTYLGTPGFGPCGTPHFARGNPRYLSFGCRDPLTANDDNERADTYLYDRSTGVLERVSLTSEEQEIRFESFGGFPSNNGRYVALESLGPLHPDATPNFPGFERRNAFLRDRVAGTTEFISRNAAGLLAQRAVGLQDSLPERREVLLQTASRLLSPNDPLGNNDTNLYIRNWTTGAIELVSGTADGSLGDNTAGLGQLTTNGRYVLFSSGASNLPGAPPLGGGSNLYLRDRQSGTTQRLTYPWQGGEFSSHMTLDAAGARSTADGRFVVFSSNHPEVLPVEEGVDLLWQQVYLLDRQSGQTERISVDASEQVADGYNGNADMSDDGRYLAFFSRSTNLPAGGPAIYVIDRQTDRWVNVTAPLGPQTGAEPNLELARDGSAIAFNWRVTDPAQPDLFNRVLMYVVDLGVAGPAPVPTPVPGPGRWWLLALCLAMLSAVTVWRTRTRA